VARRPSLSDAEILAQIPEARARGDQERAAGLLAKSARYHRSTRRLMLEMTNGVLIGLPIDLLPEVASAPAAELARVEVLGGGIVWDALDADYSVPALVTEFIGKETVSRELGRIGGSVTSKAKAIAARANGAKGGRPRKIAKKAGSR
jgi:hypothetical protein